MGAIIARLVHVPTFGMEYWTKGGQWTTKRDEAEGFATHGLADVVADQLRREGEDHAHALVSDPLPAPVIPELRRLQRQTDNAPAEFVMPAPRHRETKKQRMARIEREMREADIAQMEEAYSE